MRMLLPGDYLVVRRFGRVRLLRVISAGKWVGIVYEEPRRLLPLVYSERIAYRIGLAMRKARPGRPLWILALSPKSRLLHLLCGAPRCEVFTSHGAAKRAANKSLQTELSVYNMLKTLGRTPFAVGRSFGWPE